MSLRSATRVAAPLRASVARQTPARSVRQQVSLQSRMRTFATESTPPPPPPPAASNQSTHTAIILLAIAGLAGGVYYAVKPVVDVAHTAKSTINAAQGGASEMTDAMAGLAKSFLPPGAFALYSAVSSQSGGINGLLRNIKDADFQGVIDEVKKHGNDDVKRIVDKVEAKLKSAGGKVQDLDWKSLAQELKSELPKDKQHYIDLVIGKIPDKADLDNLIAKAKEMGEEQLKKTEQAASKVLQQVEKAKKDGKGTADAFLTGIKQSAPEDLDDLVKQLKDAAKKAGLPADQIESWLRHKAKDNKIDAESLAQNVQDKVQTASKFLPNDPQDVIKQVEQFSPSVAKLLQSALEQGKDAKKEIEKQAKK